VEDILGVRLDGGEWYDVRDYVRAKEQEQGSLWVLAEGETPLSGSQIRRYQQRADQLILESHEHSRKRLFRQHMAMLRRLYSRAVISGELRTALSVLQDIGQRARLYPGGDTEQRLRDIERQLRRLRRQRTAPPNPPAEERTCA
jgi:hypothetical protein